MGIPVIRFYASDLGTYNIAEAPPAAFGKDGALDKRYSKANGPFIAWLAAKDAEAMA